MAGITVHRSESQNACAALNREATQAKKAGDIDRAVALLQKAKAIAGQDYDDTRLAKFLEAAGRFDEAMVEVKWLLDNSTYWAKSFFSHQPASVLLRQKTFHCARIHKDAALICRRAGRADLREHHVQMHGKLMDLVDKLDPVIESDENARRLEWETARAQGGSAYREFLRKRAAATEQNRR